MRGAACSSVRWDCGMVSGNKNSQMLTESQLKLVRVQRHYGGRMNGMSREEFAQDTYKRSEFQLNFRNKPLGNGKAGKMTQIT